MEATSSDRNAPRCGLDSSCMTASGSTLVARDAGAKHATSATATPVCGESCEEPGRKG
jgi:hypothetical protein